MHWIDWLCVLVPLAVVLAVGLKAQRYVRSVADFLSAGRVAGRYVLSVSSGMAGMGLITLLAMGEMYYNSGFPIAFWWTVTVPFIFFISMTGYCTYRFRETRAMTMGQFFEIRYGKSFRLTAAVIQSCAGIINYAIFPAVGARFLVYYMNLPQTVWGMQTSMLVMAAFLSVAVIVAVMGGQVTVMVTDCVQGLFSYPMFLALLLFFLWQFSWGGQVVPALADRPAGMSLINPFDSISLRDFNIFYVLAGIFGMFLGHMTWAGSSGYNGAARTPHESKMGGLLGRWRESFNTFMYVLLAVFAFTFMHHLDFSDGAREVTAATEARVYAEVTQAETVPETGSVDAVAVEELTPKQRQTFSSLVTQMTIPMSMRHMLPVGLVGIFCALLVFLMVSTDTTYLHSWGTILVQDLVVPLLRRPLSTRTQINALRAAIVLVAVIAFVFSNTFAQFDFILMFFQITGALWAGAGAVITLGLYWSRGTRQGAFASLIVGAVIALGGFLCQANWADTVYPWLEEAGWLPAVGLVCQAVTDHAFGLVVWELTSARFPINSTELLFLANLLSLSAYLAVSLVTCRKAFDMDRMLHRGKWALGGQETEGETEAPRGFFNKFRYHILGIDSAYTRGDRVIAWAAWIWSFVYGFLLSFVAVVIWNLFSPWSIRAWGIYFFVTVLCMAILLGTVFTVWFTRCGILELRQLFRDLAARTPDRDDDGRVH